MAIRGRKRRLELESEYWQLISSGVGTVEACKQLGIGRKTGYRWRMENGGLPPERLAEDARSNRYLSPLEYPPPRSRSCEVAGDGVLDLAAAGQARYGHAGLRIRFADGTRDLALRFTGHRIGDGELSLNFEDSFFPGLRPVERRRQAPARAVAPR